MPVFSSSLARRLRKKRMRFASYAISEKQPIFIRRYWKQWGKEIAEQDSQSRRINSTRKHGTHHLRGEILIDLLIRMSCEWIAFEPMKRNYNFGIGLVI